MARELFGISQTALGKAMGADYREIQKYERGVDHVPASAFVWAARYFRVPFDFFYDGIPSHLSRKAQIPIILEMAKEWASLATVSLGKTGKKRRLSAIVDQPNEMLEILESASPRLRLIILGLISSVHRGPS